MRVTCVRASVRACVYGIPTIVLRTEHVALKVSFDLHPSLVPVCVRARVVAVHMLVPITSMPLFAGCL